MQTNAVLVDDEWVDIFSKYNVHVGYSIDGPKSLNDKYRIDHQGRGSYDRVVKGVQALNRGWAAKKITSPTVISVLNHDSNYEYDQIYHHILDQLKTRRISILLPDTTYDDGLPEELDPEYYGKQLAKIFDQWINQTEEVRFLQGQNILRFFQQFEYIEIPADPSEFTQSSENATIRNGQIIVIQSDGTVSVDDSLMPAVQWRAQIEPIAMSEMSLKQYVEQSYFDEIFEAYNTIPDECQQCCWKKYCRGGDIENRYQSGIGFKRKSIYCESLSYFYAHVVSYLVNHGYPYEKIEEKLEVN